MVVHFLILTMDIIIVKSIYNLISAMRVAGWFLDEEVQMAVEIRRGALVIVPSFRTDREPLFGVVMERMGENAPTASEPKMPEVPEIIQVLKVSLSGSS